MLRDALEAAGVQMLWLFLGVFLGFSLRLERRKESLALGWLDGPVRQLFAVASTGNGCVPQGERPHDRQQVRGVSGVVHIF